jgi:ADP-ribosylation factor-like protein 1
MVYQCVGGVLSALFSRFRWNTREYRILVVGLDGAGKTTVLNRLQCSQGDPIPTMPSTNRLFF